MTDFQYSQAFRSAVKALEKDLGEDGAQISVVRNYNFAILPYPPEEEFKLRAEIDRLGKGLLDRGWAVRGVQLHTLLLARLESLEPDFIKSMIEREKRLARAADPWRGLRALKEKVANVIEGETGLAADVIREVHRTLEESGRGPERTVIFLQRAGALYPFLRTSGLLKHLTGRTANAPVILLYPGTVDADGALSFMGVLPPDHDYRCRIYR